MEIGNQPSQRRKTSAIGKQKVMLELASSNFFVLKKI